MRRLLLPLLYLLGFTTCAQEEGSGKKVLPDLIVYRSPLGDGKLTLTVRRYRPASPLLFVKLHDNERTSEEAAVSLLEERGGTLVTLDNKGERYVSFTQGGKKFSFDPNRIFTPSGLSANLKVFRSDQETARRTVEKAARFILDKIPDSLAIIALHNNTDGRYSLCDYVEGTLKEDAALVYQNGAMDPDDFFLTTDSLLFRKLEARGVNAVLQDNEKAQDDGSLSIYYGQRERSYVNVEAQYGHRDEQERMLKLLLELLGVTLPVKREEGE